MDQRRKEVHEKKLRDVKKHLAIVQDAPKEEYIPTPTVIRHVLVATFFQSASVYLILESVSLSLSRNFKRNSRLADVLFFNATVIGAYLADNVLGVFASLNVMQPICILINASLLFCHIIEEDEISIVIIFISMFALGALANLFMTLGCDQFILPNQKHQLTNYIIYHISCTELGKIIGRWTYIVFVEIRICLTNQTCYPIEACGVLAAICAFVAIFVGREGFVKKKPSRDVRRNPGRVICCFFYAIYMHFIRRKSKGRHWLTHGRRKFGSDAAFTIQETLKMFALFFALPIFSCVRSGAQEYWVAIASKMNTNIFGYVIYPTMLVHLVPTSVVLWLVLYRIIVGKLLGRIGYKYPLQYMILGSFLVILSFIFSILVASIVESGQPAREIPPKTSQLRIYNPTECIFTIECMWLSDKYIEIKPMNYISFTKLNTEGTKRLNYSIFTRCKHIFPVQSHFNLKEEKSMGYFFRRNEIIEFEDNAIHSEDGFPLFRILANTAKDNRKEIEMFHVKTATTMKMTITNISQITVDPGVYRIESYITTIYMGDVSVLLYDELNSNKKYQIHITVANTINIAWLLIQHLMMGFALVLIDVYGTRLCYTEAPDNKKSTFLSYWALVTGIGTMLTWVIDFLHAFKFVSQNLILVTGTALTCALIFSAFAMNFDYVDRNYYF